MTDTPFIRTILENPDDDGPRLVYADWLEEDGRAERAEFIRLQIKLSTCRMCHRKGGTKRKDSYAANCGRCVPGKRREKELLTCSGSKNTRIAVKCSDPECFRCSMLPDVTLPFEPIYRRGFVDEIHCTMSAFCGETCHRCEGQRTLIGNPDCDYCQGYGRVADSESEDSDATMDCFMCERTECPDCNGSGVTSGIARAVFMSQPVVTVRITDREPLERENDGIEFGWCIAGMGTIMPDARWMLPESLWNLIETGDTRRLWSRIWKTFPTRAAALLALSDAACRLGRSLAGIEVKEQHANV